MELAELASWGIEFETFCNRFGGLFKRSEPRQQAAQYLRGLLLPLPRKNGWQLAEAVGEPLPDSTQRLLYHARWDADAARDELQRFVVEQFSDAGGIVVLDETGFIKKGDKSAGVQRQYCGTAGKVENCQLGVFVSYWTPAAHVLVDRALYLPRCWTEEPARCRAAKVPAEVEFQTKQELGLAMLRRVRESALEVAWLTADEAYGDSAELRREVSEELGWQYVLAISCNTPAWSERPAVEAPSNGARGRPRTRSRVAADTPSHQTVQELVAAWPQQRWERLAVAEGEQGPLTYDWGRQRIVERRDGLPGADLWLLARRSTGDPTELAYYFSNASADVDLLTLAQVASRRFSVEQCFQEAKSEVGLDEYEVRYWHSWHRHITLSMLALAFLVHIRALEAAGKKGRRSSPN